MPSVYIVRCNFTEPSREQAWNDWYSGPKIAQMLSKPHFRTCQRFRKIAGRGRNYLALWVLESPQAFKTQQYTSDWGFFEWQPFITDWSRDLFDGGSAAEIEFAVPPGGALQVVSFDGASADGASTARDSIGTAHGMMWLPIAGLDRHTPIIGLRVLNKANSAELSAIGERQTLQQAIYRPISDFATAEKP